jgi:hypothetical protein
MMETYKHAQYMKINRAVYLLLLSTVAAGRGASPSGLSTNQTEGPVRAPALPPVEARPNPPSTNGPPGPGPVHLTSTLTREIKLTEAGAAATYGLTKVFWKSDIAAERPITITTPDGRTLYCRPAFLILRNRVLDQSVLLGSVTNRVGEMSENSVTWTNILDSGPNISIEYRYLPNGLEQNVIALESPEIPSAWTNSDVAIEFWTEWIDATPTASETRTVALRTEAGSLPAVQADDQQISFGPVSKLVAGGRAFSLGAEADSLPVAKTWASVAPTNGAPARNFIIEELDWSAASSQLLALPPTSRHASLFRPKSSRSALLQAALVPERSRYQIAKSSRSKFLVSSTRTPAHPRRPRPGLPPALCQPLCRPLCRSPVSLIRPSS